MWLVRRAKETNWSGFVSSTGNQDPWCLVYKLAMDDDPAMDTERHRALRVEAMEDYTGVDVPLFNRKELHDVVRSCRNKKAPGLDLLTAEILDVRRTCQHEDQAGGQGGERHGDGYRVESGGPAHVLEGEDEDDPPQGEALGDEAPDGTYTWNGSGSGEGCVREAHPSFKDFLGIGLLDSTEDVQRP
uniref:Uncharacterized protein n=1 Tax=Timema poppense TaxID=170557 RepID=A0A7R9DJW0_TIMPO|nr:unnamed protein product [Timema poppensis]